MKYVPMKTEIFTYRGVRVAVDPLAFNSVRVYLNGKLFAQGSREFIKYYLERAKDHVDNRKGDERVAS